MILNAGTAKNYYRLFFVIIISLLFFSCAKNTDRNSSSSDIRLALMVKRADNNWYQLQIKGFENKCRELGVQFLILDNRMDSNLTLSDIDTLISRKVNGVAIAIPEQKMSWIVVNRIFEAGIPVISMNYKLIDKQNRQLAPHIGIDYIKAGVTAERWIAKRLKENQLLTDPAISFGIAELYSRSVLEIQEWSETIKAGLSKDLHGLKKGHFYRINSPVNDAAGAMITMQQLLSEHPDITNWIIYAGSSDEMNGALRALDQVGMKKYSLTLSIEAGITGKGNFPGSSRSRAVILVDTYNQGQKAAELLYNNVKYKIPIPSGTDSVYELKE